MAKKMIVGVKKLHPDAKLPTYVDSGASGFDFYANENITLPARGRAIIRTGLAFEIPRGYEIQARGRSGLAFKNNIVAAHFGTIDENYKGEVMILLYNFSSTSYLIMSGDRVAQGVLAPVTRADFYETTELSDSERGTKGFGDSGK
jgi:dUTP pyrophosphatase